MNPTDHNEFDTDQEDLFNSLLLMAENNSLAYDARNPEAAIDAAFKYNLEVIVGNLNFDYNVIKPLLLRQLQAKWSDAAEEGTVPCKFCTNFTPASTAHLHQGTYICESCFDERLRTTQ